MKRRLGRRDLDSPGERVGSQKVIGLVFALAFCFGAVLVFVGVSVAAVPITVMGSALMGAILLLCIIGLRRSLAVRPMHKEHLEALARAQDRLTHPSPHRPEDSPA
jgi:Flp pilus assembly protein TadB